VRADDKRKIPDRLLRQGPRGLPLVQHKAMVETAAHLTDHLFPHFLVRQRALSVPKPMRYFLQRGDAP
jgi:hypothetical protein